MFDWDDANISHIAGHGVLPSEAEEVVQNNPLDLGYEDIDGELRFRQVGETSKGRILQVVSTDRAGLVRVVTAFEPSRVLRVVYLRFRVGV